ncbi:hypothetical protein [Tateyamaria sp.]|uniref:hypothetical protein n=1 Tax=Tateyamaria sp. TaxID=1929288 RepID=UPI003B224AAD
MLHDDDLSPGYILDTGLAPRASAIVTTRKILSPLAIAPHVDAFATSAADDAAGRYGERLGEMSHLTASVSAIVDWAAQNDLQQIVTPYTPVGPNADLIARLRRAEGAPPVKAVRRAYDSAAWPHATHGFFRFKDKIPSLIGQMRGLSPAT